MRIGKFSMVVMVVAVALMFSGTVSAGPVWTFTNPSDYYVDGDSGTAPANINYMPVITPGVGAYVPPRPYVNSADIPYGSDWAAVFARVNTLAPALKVSDIYGGNFTVSGMNHPDALYGSLYLSPTGGSGANVLINLGMTRTGSNGNYMYTFDLDSPADVLTGPGWGYAQPQGSLNFGQAIGWIDSSAFAGDYAAFFGPQIGMSGTSDTTFTVSRISLNPVPEPLTMFGVFMGVGGVGTYLRRRLLAA
jgi:hypothetical protein